MQVKRFVAADMRRALEMVRQEMGPDAIILSSGRVPEGVEILTTMGSDSELMQLQQQPLGRLALSTASPMASDGAWAETAVIERAAKQQAASVKRPAFEADGNLDAKRHKSGQELADDIERARARMLAAKEAEASAKEFLVTKTTRVNAAIPRFETPAATPVKPTARVGARVESHKPIESPKPAKGMSAAERYPLIDDEEITIHSTPADNRLDVLQAELADMRMLLEQQLDRIATNRLPALAQSNQPQNPVLASVERRLQRLGIPADAVSRVLQRSRKTRAITEAWPEALANLAHDIPVLGQDIVDQGGVFAFVGPTGVGKTTTIGKLAARYVLKHGADKVALITTDTYRIAAHDQLRSLARILRIPVRVVDESNTLDSLLRNLRHVPLVLIDTAGFRHGDPHLKAQLQALAAIKTVKTLLVMSCNSQEQMLKASIHAYGAAGLYGCVLTKLDETASMGEALGVVMQQQLKVVYTTDGQDIPKHLDVAKGHQLVAKAAALLQAAPASAVS